MRAITSLTAASAAEPESGRSRTTAAASPGRRSASSAGLSASVSAPSSPPSRRSAVSVRTAHRHGAICKSVSMPAFAPRTNAPYTSIRANSPAVSTAPQSAGRK